MPVGSPPLGLVPLELENRPGPGAQADGLADSTLANVIAAEVQARRLRDFARQRLDKARVQRAEAEEQARRASAELEAFQARGKQMREEVHASRREVDILKLDLGELATRVSGLEADLVRANSVVEGLESDLEAAQKRRAELTSTLDAERLEATQAEKKVQAARQLRDLQRSAVANAEAVVTDLKQRAADAEAERQRGAALLADALQGSAAIAIEIDGQRERIAELDRELADARARQTSTQAEADHERSSLERASAAVAELRQSRLHAEHILATERLAIARQQQSIGAVGAIANALREEAAAKRLEAARAEIATAAARAEAEQNVRAEQTMRRERDAVRYLHSLIRLMRAERAALESEALQGRIADARARAGREHMRAAALRQARNAGDEAAAQLQAAIADERIVRTQLTRELEIARTGAAAVAGKVNDAVARKAAAAAELARIEPMIEVLEDRRAALEIDLSAAHDAIRSTVEELERQRAQWQENEFLAGELRLGVARAAAEAARLEAELAARERASAATTARLSGQWQAANDPVAAAADEAQAESAASDLARTRSARETLGPARPDTPARRGNPRRWAWPWLAGALVFSALVMYLVPRVVPLPSVNSPSTAQAKPRAQTSSPLPAAPSATIALPPLYGTDAGAQRDLLLSFELRAAPGLR